MTEAEMAISYPPTGSAETGPEGDERFRLVLEASPDGFMMLQPVRNAAGEIADFMIDYANPIAAQGVNRTPVELIGQSLLQLWPDCQPSGNFDRYVTVAQTGVSTTFETVHESQNGAGWSRNVVVKLNDGIAVSFSDITEHKQAESALQQRDQHFRVALQTAKLGSWEYDLLTGVLTCSAQCKANFGLPADAEFTHATLFAALHPEDRPLVEAAIQRSIRERTDYEVEERCYHPDGSLHWLIVRGQIVYDSRGQPMRLVGVTLDITDRKQTEIALRESQELFQSFMNHSPIAAFIKDESGRYLYANSWIEHVYQRSQSELIGKTDFELLPPEIARQFHQNDRAVLASGQPMQTLETINHEDGEHSYMSFKFPFRTETGQQLVAGVAVDISERVQAEMVLQQREAELRLITNAVPVLISFVNAEQRYRFNNQKYEEWFGKPATDIQGKYLWEVLGEAPYETIRPYIEQVLAGQEVTFETKIPYQGVGLRDAVVTYIPHFEPQGNVEGFVALINDITQRKQAEQTLKQSEERLRIAQQAANAGVWDWDMTTNQVTWSDEYYQLYGLDPAVTQPSYENWLNSILEQDRDHVNRAASQALAHHVDLNVEFRILHPTQGERWLTAIGQTFYDQQGCPKRMTGIALDITGRKQAEKALERYRLLSEYSRDIVLYFRDNGQILEANQAAVQAYGYDRAELLTLRVADLRAPHTLTILPEQFKQAVQRGILFETMHRRKDGSVFPVEVSAQSAVIGNENVVLSVIRDITERKRAESEREQLLIREKVAREAAEAAEQRAQFLAEVSTTLNSSLDYEYTLSSLAQAVVPDLADWCAVDILKPDGRLERLATTHIDPIKAEWGIELHRRYPPNLDAPHGIAQVLRTGQSEYYPMIADDQIVAAARDPEHLKILRKIGFSSAMLVPLRGRDRILGTISFISAESGRFYSVEDLSLAEELARRAAIALDNARLYQEAQQAQQDAERANRIKDEFLAVLSHELRSPLNPILGWAKLLQTRQFDQPATKRALETIERNAKLQTQLIDDLLDVSRILRGKMVLDMRPVNLEDVIDAGLETVRLSSEAKNIEIQKLIADDVGLILGDAGRLQQVVWNLLSNAVKFTPSGGRIEIELALVTGHASGVGERMIDHKEQVINYAQITVRDSGKGITPEFLPHVFDYFRQEDGTITRKFGGLGLGLAIVRYLTELHGGSVKVESPGECGGATFTVLLPISNANSGSSPERAESASLTAAGLPLANLKVLVVDDEADMRDLIVAILQQAGAEVQVATSAIAALTALEAVKPAILISDIGMPEIDGYELLRQIRRRSPEQGGEIPAIALTAYAGEINQQRALAVGFQRHLAKPVEPEELVKAIITLVAGPDRSDHPEV